MANRFDLAQLISQRQQQAAAGEEFTTKIGAQSISQHGYVEHINHLGELLHLLGTQELSFIH